MTYRSPLLALPFVTFAQIAHADVPNVVTDMAPIQSLVTQVMGELGEPDVLMPQGASPHGYSLRPSEARALQNADVVFWVGHDLEPWLEEMIEKVAADAVSVPLTEAEGAIELPFREGATFEKHSHDHEDEHEEHDDHDDHGHDDHDDHADHDDHDHEEHGHDDHDEHDDHADHDDHDDHEGHDDHDDHAHEDHADHDDHEAHDEHEEHAAHDDHDDHHGSDPHAWLDPQNGVVWLDAIADTLSEQDPENAATYHANADAAQVKLEAQIATLSEELAPLADLKFIVFHDAYQYFENRFGLTAAGSISLGDASAPSPARVKEVQDKIAEIGVACVFSEPQFNAGLVDTVLDGAEAKSLVSDPLGVHLEMGANFYGDLIEGLADTFKACAAE